MLYAALTINNNTLSLSLSLPLNLSLCLISLQAFAGTNCCGFKHECDYIENQSVKFATAAKRAIPTVSAVVGCNNKSKRTQCVCVRGCVASGDWAADVAAGLERRKPHKNDIKTNKQIYKYDSHWEKLLKSPSNQTCWPSTTSTLPVSITKEFISFRSFFFGGNL